MSKVQFDAFYRKVGEDEALRQKLMALRGNSEEVFRVIAGIARDEGYDVVEEDFAEAFGGNGEMDEGVLEQVVGGKNCGGDPNCTRVCGECCGTFLGTYIGRQ